MLALQGEQFGRQVIIPLPEAPSVELLALPTEFPLLRDVKLPVIEEVLPTPCPITSNAMQIVNT